MWGEDWYEQRRFVVVVEQDGMLTTFPWANPHQATQQIRALIAIGMQPLLSVQIIYGPGSGHKPDPRELVARPYEFWRPFLEAFCENTMSGAGDFVVLQKREDRPWRIQRFSDARTAIGFYEVASRNWTETYYGHVFHLSGEAAPDPNDSG